MRKITWIFSLLLLACNNVGLQKRQLEAKQYKLLNDDKEVNQIIPELSNWNKWGENDEKGTINYITSEKIVEAARLIKKGKTVSLARPTSITQSKDIREGRYEMQKGKYGSRDYVGAVWHGFSVTHLDALCHVFADTARMYNGYSVEHLTEEGATKLGLEKLAEEGITGRGILIDVAEYYEQELTLGQAILPSDLDNILAQQNIEIESGDILFIRTGFGEKNIRSIRTGLHPSCIKWVKEKEISLLGGDGDNDAYPISFTRWGSPFHTIGIPYLGLPLIDNADLEELSRVCKEENRYEFFISISPWKIIGTTSCPINPIAIF